RCGGEQQSSPRTSSTTEVRVIDGSASSATPPRSEHLRNTSVRKWKQHQGRNRFFCDGHTSFSDPGILPRAPNMEVAERTRQHFHEVISDPDYNPETTVLPDPPRTQQFRVLSILNFMR
ncbi:hypothetical protein OESDEN_08604, partial [Oesophagostomum dentatum]